MFQSNILDQIEVFTQSSIRIGVDKVIYVDPFHMQEERHDANIILITHDHYDHFSPEDMKKVLKEDTVIVVPKLLEQDCQKVAPGNPIICVRPNQEINVCGIVIETVPAYNNHKPFHPKKKGWVGYILTLGDTRCYIAGDTDATSDIKTISCDIAMVPIGGIYTMNAKKAADLINQMKPKVAIPTHYGSIVGKPEDADVFQSEVNSDIEVIIKIKCFN